jgi:hypothetical protein
MDSDTRYLGAQPAVPRADNSPPTAAFASPAEILTAGTRRRIQAFGRRNSNLLPLALIVLGLLIFFGHPNFAAAAGATVPLGLGLVLLYAYFQQGQLLSFLVPAAILTGLGLGGVAAALTGFIGLLPIGLGLGFCAVWQRERLQWWALFPGVVLSLVGSMLLLGQSLGRLGTWLPVLLVVSGLWLLMSRRTVRSK